MLVINIEIHNCNKMQEIANNTFILCVEKMKHKLI